MIMILTNNWVYHKRLDYISVVKSYKKDYFVYKIYYHLSQ